MMKKRVMTAIGALLVLVLTASIVAAQTSYPDPGSSVTNIVTQNLSTGVGEDASVVVQYYDQAGTLEYTHSSISIAPKAVVEIKTDDEPLGDGWEGSAVMSSDRALGAVVSIKNTSVPGAPDGFTQGAYQGANAGADTLYFPSLYAFSGIVSRITVQNVEGTPADIEIDYYDRAGTYLGQHTDTIPAYSQATYFLGDAADVPFDPETEFVDGSAIVTSSSGNLLAGAAVSTWANRSSAYQALTPLNQATTLYAPSHYRFQDSGGSWLLFSALNLQNTSLSDTANVTATYTSRSDGSVSLVKTFTIAPGSAAGLNTKNGGDFPASDFDDLSNAGGGVADWDGSVEIESDQPLVGICNTGWDAAGNAGTFALVGSNEAANEVFFPAQYRRSPGFWAQWSAVNLMNIGGSTIAASDLSIEYVDQAGTTVLTLTGTDLPGDLTAGAALGLNTRNGGDLSSSAFSPLGDAFIGGVYISAPVGSELVGVANVVYSNRASVYNAFPGP